MKYSSLNKFIASVLFIVFVVTPFFMVGPEKLNAQLSVPGVSVPVNDFQNNLKESGVSVFGVPTGLGLDGLAFMAANLIIARITDSIVSWINTGFQGNPSFIQDPGAWFVETADIASGALFEELGVADFLCTPFAPIRAALVWNYNERKFTRDYKCKLSNAINNIGNFTAFTSGDFTGQGGWDTWFNITQNPSNNPYGTYLGAQIELDRRIASAIGLEKTKLDWGNGFLSSQECLESSEDPNLPHRCVKYGPIETPGSVIQEQLNNALDSERGRILVADEINEIISALMNQLVTQVFAGGLSNMGGGGTINPGSGADFTVSCSVTPTTPIYLQPQTQTTQPVTFSSTVVGGVGTATYSWVLTGNPSPAAPATTINLGGGSVTPVTYSATGVGPQTARVSVTKDTGAGVMTKYATCNINVLADPPLSIDSCSVSPSVVRWQYDPRLPGPGYTNPTWTVNVSGGALNSGTPTQPQDMGYCVFDWWVGSAYHWVITAPLVGTPSGSTCTLTTDYRVHGQAQGDTFKSVTVHSGGQTSGPRQCGPLTTLYP